MHKENKQKTVIVLFSLEDCVLASQQPFQRRKKATINMINSLTIKQTDCSMTYDFMMESLDKCIALVKNLTSNELFEIIINLNDKGLNNLHLHLLKEWNHSKINVWDYRHIQTTIKHLRAKNVA